MKFYGFVTLGGTITIPVQTVSSLVPTNADAAPRRVVLNGTSRIAAGAGQSSQLHTGTITDATNASPIVITSANHGLETGHRVTIINVGGNTAANGTFNITKVSASTFSLDGSTGNGAYTSGGTFNVSGLYYHSIEASNGNGFARGHYVVYTTWAISSSARAEVGYFTVT